MAYSKNAYDYQSFIDESRDRFGDIYEYPNIENEYSNSHSKIHFKCKKCGNVFTKIACDHLTSPHGGCLLCYSNKSKCEEEIGEFIQGLFGDEVILRGRDILDRYELDIYIPSLKIGIEYNGLYWHREEKKGKYYHLNKLQMCNQKGIKLIQIFEDEYIHPVEGAGQKLFVHGRGVQNHRHAHVGTLFHDVGQGTDFILQKQNVA